MQLEETQIYIQWILLRISAYQTKLHFSEFSQKEDWLVAPQHLLSGKDPSIKHLLVSDEPVSVFSAPATTHGILHG